MSWKLKRTIQCEKCPWHVDVDPYDIPNGYDVERHRALQSTIATPGSLRDTGRAMACHETGGNTKSWIMLLTSAASSNRSMAVGAKNLERFYGISTAGKRSKHRDHATSTPSMDQTVSVDVMHLQERHEILCAARASSSQQFEDSTPGLFLITPHQQRGPSATSFVVATETISLPDDGSRAVVTPPLFNLRLGIVDFRQFALACLTSGGSTKQPLAIGAELFQRLLSLASRACFHQVIIPDEPSHCVGWLMNQLGPGNNIGLRMRMMSCENAKKIRLRGEQHETFEDTLP